MPLQFYPHSFSPDTRRKKSKIGVERKEIEAGRKENGQFQKVNETNAANFQKVIEMLATKK